MLNLLPLLLFVVVSTITPGGATTLATTSGVHFGFARSLPLMCGIALGLASLAMVASLGLGSVLLAMPTLQIAVKLLGSAYLLWLAWRIAHARPPGAGANPPKPISLVKGFLLLWLNPKSWAVTVGAAASFSTLADRPAKVAVLLGTSFGLAACVSLSLWCALGMLLARFFSTPLRWRRLNIAMAVLLSVSVAATWR